MKPIGLYIHVPFCAKKCNYCDFYSLADQACADEYVTAVCREIERYDFVADTLYFGGGTPSQLTARQLGAMLDTASKKLTSDAEITMEANPGDPLTSLLPELVSRGLNRVSLGVQTTDNEQLKKLGRRHDFEQVKHSIEQVRMCGIENLSVDLMLGIEGQTEQSLTQSVDYVKSEDVPHVSAYLLKVEEGTPLHAMRRSIHLPDEDAQAALYERLAKQLTAAGYEHYEISNFAKPGRRSRHNMKYWNADEYLGIGPSAHSFFEGKRFYYPRDLQHFLSSPAVIGDGAGGSEEEYLMLRLRLKDGVVFEEYRKRFGNTDGLREVVDRAIPYHDFLVMDEHHLALNEKGFLVSNAILSEIL